VSAILVNNVKIAEDKKLDDLVSALGELALNEPRMKGARDAFSMKSKGSPRMSTVGGLLVLGNLFRLLALLLGYRIRIDM